MEAIDFTADPAPAPLRALPSAPVVRVAGERILVDRLVLSDAALAAALAERDEADRPAIVERALRIGLIAIQDAVTSVDTDVVRREFGKLVREPVDEVELRRTKNYLKGRMVLQLEDPRGLLSFGLRREVLENRLAEPEEVLEGLEAVTAADIQRLAGEVIREEGLNFGVVGPFDDDAHFLEIMTV